MYENKEGIWSLSEIVNNAKEERSCMADLWYILKDQKREVREVYSDIYFNGIERGLQRQHYSPLDYANCCLEEALQYKKGDMNGSGNDRLYNKRLW